MRLIRDSRLLQHLREQHVQEEQQDPLGQSQIHLSLDAGIVASATQGADDSVGNSVPLFASMVASLKTMKEHTRDM